MKSIESTRSIKHMYTQRTLQGIVLKTKGYEQFLAQIIHSFSKLFTYISPFLNFSVYCLAAVHRIGYVKYYQLVSSELFQTYTKFSFGK